VNNQIDLNAVVGYMIMIMMIGMMMKLMTKELKPAAERPLIYGPRGERLTHSSSSEIRRLGEPRGEEERTRVHEEFYGTGELPVRGTGLSERGESAESRRLGEPKTAAERRETHKETYGTSELPGRGKGRGSAPEGSRSGYITGDGFVVETEGGHSDCPGCGTYTSYYSEDYVTRWGEVRTKTIWHCDKCGDVEEDIPYPTEDATDREYVEYCFSLAKKYGHVDPSITRAKNLSEHHSIHGPERQKLVDEFGSWATGRAEAVCPEDDVECVRREAGRLIYAYRRSFTG